MWVAGFWCRSGGVQCSSSGCTGSSSRGAAGTATRIRTSRRFSGARIWRLPSGGVGLARSASEHRYTLIDNRTRESFETAVFSFQASPVSSILSFSFLSSLSLSLSIFIPLTTSSSSSIFGTSNLINTTENKRHCCMSGGRGE